MPYCAILSCKNASHTKNLSNGGISYHRFPKSDTMKSQWIKATGRLDWQPAKSSTICSEHFKEVDFVIGKGGYKYLTETAKPVETELQTQTTDKDNEMNESSVKKLHAMLRFKQCKIDKQQVKIKSLQTQVRRLTRRLEDLKENCLCGAKKSEKSSVKSTTKQLHEETDNKEEIKIEHVKEESIIIPENQNENKLETNFEIKVEENETQNVNSSDIFDDNEPTSDIFDDNEPTSDIFDDNEPTSDIYDDNEPISDIFDDNDTASDISDNISDDDIDLESLRNKSAKKCKKPAKSKSKKVKQENEKIVPTKKCSIDYTQYEAVFDIQLFKSDEDAKKELQSRLSSEPYTSAKHRCERCYTVYKCEKLLQFHMKWHDSTAEVECDICRMRFANKRVLLKHKHRCHRGKFTCKLCPLITYYGTAMKAHFEKHQGKTYKCHCGGEFKHISSYLTHKRKAHARTSTHVCVTCARSFVSRLGLLNHRSRAHQTRSLEDAEGGVVCSQCELTFPNQGVLNVHVLSTHKLSQAANDIIACRHCGLTFEYTTQLRQHKRDEHPTTPRDRYAEAKRSSGQKISAASKQDCCYTCDECGAEGKGRMWRLQHYRKEHPQIKYKASEDATQHMCDQCGRLFSSIYVLRDHLNKHLGLRPWTCRGCPLTFSSYGARAQHEVRHGAPLACPYCPARFHSTSGLCMHKRRHVGARSHVCGVCGRAFLLAAQLREHVRAVHQHRRRRQPPRDRRAAPTRHKPVVTRIQLTCEKA